MSEHGILRELKSIREHLGRESKTDMFEKCAKAIPLVYGFIILCGALHLDILYTPFRINIFKYLELSEVLISFVHLALPILLQIGFLICYFAAYFLILEFASIFIKNEQKKFSWKKIGDQKIFHSIYSICSTASVVLTIMYISSYYESSIKKAQEYNLDLALIIFLVITALLLLFQYNAQGGAKYLLINMIITLLVSTVHQSYADINNVLNDSTNQTTTIVTKADTINTTSSYYYVGRTNNYVFLYNSLDSTRDVIPTSEIKQITFNWKKKKNSVHEFHPPPNLHTLPDEVL